MRKEVLDGTDVIKVGVREKNGFNAILLSFERSQVRYEIVDAEHVLIGKLQSQIDDVDVCIDFNDEAVAPNLFKPAERVDAEFSRRSVPGSWKGSADLGSRGSISHSRGSISALFHWRMNTLVRCSIAEFACGISMLMRFPLLPV